MSFVVALRYEHCVSFIGASPERTASAAYAALTLGMPSVPSYRRWS